MEELYEKWQSQPIDDIQEEEYSRDDTVLDEIYRKLNLYSLFSIYITLYTNTFNIRFLFVLKTNHHRPKPFSMVLSYSITPSHRWNNRTSSSSWTNKTTTNCIP